MKGARPNRGASRNAAATPALEDARPTPEATVSLEGGELVIRVRLDAQRVDELVAICAEGLAAYGLELRAVQGLIADGKLRAVSIGRRRFTRRSYLLALVDELDVASTAEPKAKPADVLTLAASKAARRASARNGVNGKGAAA